MKKNLLLCAVATSLAAPAFAQKPPAKSPNGVWHCSAAGPLPIGIMTITGTGYKFQAVSNTAWAPKASDRNNGGGQFKIAPGKLTPVSGPLVSGFKASVALHEEYRSPRESYDYIDIYNDPKSAYLLRCYRPD